MIDDIHVDMEFKIEHSFVSQKNHGTQNPCTEVQ